LLTITLSRVNGQ